MASSEYIYSNNEVVLNGTRKNIPSVNIPELDVKFSRNKKLFEGRVVSSNDVAKFLKSILNEGEIELQEHFIVIYLDNANQILGYYKHAKGGIRHVIVDTKIILATALKCLAAGIILCHNHPSGILKASEDDLKITKEIKEAAKMMNMLVLDHIIITKDSHLSFIDEGLLGTEAGILTADMTAFVAKVESDLLMREKHDKRSIEALARSFNIIDRTEIKELTELAIVRAARQIAQRKNNIKENYERIVQLYGDQIILSHRTSQSILLQQYSTPAPIAFLMGIFCGIHRFGSKQSGLEPSAGNGLLTIAGKPENFFVNEVDYTRNRNLRSQGYKLVKNLDASRAGQFLPEQYDAVLTNPPFGIVDKAVVFDGFPIRVLDHIMAIRALESMKDTGKAAIIISGHSRWDRQGRLQKGKNRWFFNYLYSHYHVKDVIPIEGRKLYTRQGTGVRVRLILISGRKSTVNGVAPLKSTRAMEVVKSFDALFERVMEHYEEVTPVNEQQNDSKMDLDEIKRKARELRNRLGLGEIDGNLSDATSYYSWWRLLKSSYPGAIIFIRTETVLLTYDEQAIRMAKLFKARYITVKNSKGVHELFAKTIDEQEEVLLTLWKERLAVFIQPIVEGDTEDLGAIYVPASESSSLDTQVPDSMAFETQSAVSKIKEYVGGSMDNFVRHRLGYSTRADLYQALAAEQIDAVGMAIYNVEAREQGMIIGDQTGIGKGRVAAAMIRYAVQRGLKPVFLTEKANLFSDIYRDLVAIDSAHLKPFIINNREAKTDIKDEDGEIVYTALSPIEQLKIFESEAIPDEFDYVVATYSQFNSADRKPTKPNYLRAITRANILIMDEAHNSSGEGKTAEFMIDIVAQSLGVMFLSATFAKKPANMPIYAMKTVISEANLSRDNLVKAIKRGGVALQEILSSQVVADGQMIRRERSFEGIEVNYIQLDEYEEAHRRASDKITNILRYIIAFQEAYVDKKVSEMDKELAIEGEQVAKRGGTSQAGVDSLPYFSKVFNVINQMLFSIKAEAVAERAIMRLKEGKKPVIAFSSTMGSFVEQMASEEGLSVKDGDTIRTDFSEVLRKGLEGVLRYTVYDETGEPTYQAFEVKDLGPGAVENYENILDEIDRVSTGISISPIDIIVAKLEGAGYSVGEVTGRKFRVQLEGDTGTVYNRKKITTNDAFRKFNNNEIDVLLINQSGSTGASAHAIVTSKVPKEQVKQRVMLILQAELDINTEVQKRGRINRTGQILKPIYDYVMSAIPAEKRLMMMLQKKLKSLDANTTSNQKQSTSILDVPDFLNKYGDKIAQEYLAENPEINKLLGQPLNDPMEIKSDQNESYVEDAAHKVSGRVAVLSTKMQGEFYYEMTERYNDYVEYLKQIGEYDLEVEALDLKTVTLESNIIKMGKGGESAFGDDSILEKVQANILRKPFRKDEVEALVNETLNGKTAEAHRDDYLEQLTANFQARMKTEIQELNTYYEMLIREIPNEKKIKRLRDEDVDAFLDAMEERKKELEKEQQDEIELIQSGKSGREQYVRRVIGFFTIGRKLAFPQKDSVTGETVLAISLGVVINKNKKNPFARSAVKVRLAIANGMKYVSIPASREDDISKIIASSHDIEQIQFENLLEEWEAETKRRAKDRGMRFIITGNLLQAFDSLDEQGGKLVSYTTQDNQVKKGILMPEDWKPEDQGKQRVTVPIMKGLKLLQSLTTGHTILASDGISFIKGSGAYTIVVPASRSKGGAIYLDQEIWPLIVNNKFEIASDKMKAILPEDNIEALAEILQRKHSISLKVGLNQLSLVEMERVKIANRKPIELPPDQDDQELERVRIIKLKAKAIALKLKLKLAA